MHKWSHHATKNTNKSMQKSLKNLKLYLIEKVLKN